MVLGPRCASSRPSRSRSRALAVVVGYPDAHYTLANALLERDEPDRAARHFEMALQTMPDSVEARNNLGIALGSLGRLDDAIVE